jgi:hypothetical protein
MLVFTPTVAMAGPNYVWNNSAYPGLPAVYGCKAIDSKNVYSCGNPDGVGNYILYYDGTALSVQHPPAPFVTLHGVDGSDPGHVWTVGNGGYVAFSNGSGTWATQASGTGDTLYGVVAIARDNAWAVGGHAGASTATHWNGTNWTATSTLGAPLHGITAFDASNVWAVGENGIILFYNGTTTVAQASGTASTIYSVSAVAPNDVWAVGAGGLALHFNGTAWSTVATGTGETLYGVKALDSRNVLAVGTNGKIIHWQGGSSWPVEDSGTTAPLWCVDAANESRCFTGGGTGANGVFMMGWSNTKPTWYLAEGSTAWGFSEYISVQNPNDDTVNVDITYMTGGGALNGGSITMPPSSQATINPASVVSNQDFSALVVCREGLMIAADRTMSWTGTGAPSPEGHSSVGVPFPNKTWYLPEGSSQWGFETWLLIQNPNNYEATCQVTYMVENGTPVVKEKKVPANSRKTFAMVDDIGAKDASIQVVSNLPVIPERSMYRNNKREGTDSIGTIAPAADYYLAEGTTAWGFTTYVLVQNPNPTPTDVTLTFNTPDGAKVQPAFTMQGNTRKTIRVNDIKPANGYPIDVSNTDLSTEVHGTQPIIAERSMYWGAGTPLGEAAHDSIGMGTPDIGFMLPDGDTSNGRETWALVQNPNNVDVTIMVMYMTPTGIGDTAFNDVVPKNSRKTYNMSEKLANSRGSIFVLCETGGAMIMVERAMYWNNRGAGTGTIGTGIE